jgi:hypothetical protein
MATIVTPYSYGGDGDAWFSALVATSQDTGAPRYLMGVSLLHPESPWRLDLSSVGITGGQYQPEAVQLGSVVAVDDQLDYYQHRLLGVDVRTGHVLWTLRCPGGGYSSTDFVRIDTDPPDTMRMRCGRGGSEPGNEYLFAPDGALTQIS